MLPARAQTGRESEWNSRKYGSLTGCRSRSQELRKQLPALFLSQGPVAAAWIVPAISGPVVPTVAGAAAGRAGWTWRAAPGAVVLLFLHGIVLKKIIIIIWHGITPFKYLICYMICRKRTRGDKEESCPEKNRGIKPLLSSGAIAAFPFGFGKRFHIFVRVCIHLRNITIAVAVRIGFTRFMAHCYHLQG